MREILFRGKRVDNGEWISGDLITTPFIRNETQQNIIYILDITKADYDCFEDLTEDNGIFEVNPETVCQYTGLTDKNGRKIFEGDILSFSAYSENYKGDVRFIKGNFTIWCEKCAPFLDDALEKHSAIVIGNIFDNPELIGE